MPNDDVIQQAREAMCDVRGCDIEQCIALRAIVEAADAGHLIDTRRLDALAEKGIAIIPEGRSKMHKWEVWHGEIYATAPTFAEALAAAEREAT